jgi:hypothetical protein
MELKNQKWTEEASPENACTTHRKVADFTHGGHDCRVSIAQYRTGNWHMAVYVSVKKIDGFSVSASRILPSEEECVTTAARILPAMLAHIDAL